MIKISEIFGPTIQGEGALIGQPTIFVRTGGCDYQCSWCDTLYAARSEFRKTWTPMTTEDIFAEVEKLSSHNPMMVTLTGGNPAIHPLGDLIALGQSKGYRFAMETQGTIAQNWFADLDDLTLSPKPPSSGMKTDWSKFDDCLVSAANGPAISMKIVIFDDADYAYAKDAAARYPHLPLYLQPGNATVAPQIADQQALQSKLRWLAERVQNDNNINAAVTPQLHVMMWGNQRGV